MAVNPSAPSVLSKMARAKAALSLQLPDQELKEALAAHPELDSPTISAAISLMQVLAQRRITALEAGGHVETTAAAIPEHVVEGRQPHVYRFGRVTDGNASMKSILGGKGANLAEMANIGQPVPPGFTITTLVCAHYAEHKSYPDSLHGEVDGAIAGLEEQMNLKFGDDRAGHVPLLLSVRSGAAVSMPGMMDTVLNLGLNDSNVEHLAKATTRRFALDSYRRFIQMYGNVVANVDGDLFEENLEKAREAQGVHLDKDLNEASLEKIIAQHKACYKKSTGADFPQNPKDQIWGGVTAVFKSWNNARAIKYREINKIKNLLGTAVNVQVMVYGNKGESSATGVCFTRNPSTGEKALYGEYLVNAQGEDVVAGIRTPQQIMTVQSREWAAQQGITEAVRAAKFPSLEECMPELCKELLGYCYQLEDHFADMQDIEFTIEDGRLFMLQCRSGKRTVTSAVRCAVDMVQEKMIPIDKALMRVNAIALNQLLHPTIDDRKGKVIATGLPASPGAAVGQAVFSAATAAAWAEMTPKRDVILIRAETSPEDIAGMHASKGVLTSRGGMTSHAAVVARGMGVPCVSGCAAVVVKNSACTIGDAEVKEGDWISLDGTSGKIFIGKADLKPTVVSGHFEQLMNWAKQFKRIGVRANADTVADAQVAKDFGAEGIGLVRTEHMFFKPERIEAVRQMILATDLAMREEALARLEPMQKGDFEGIFKVMGNRGVCIRLLDPPLHEFLPHKDFEPLAALLKTTVACVERRIQELREENPMMGHRGCRLGITYPEIYNMQVRAIISAAANVSRESGNSMPSVEIMIPLVGKVEELALCRRQAEEAAHIAIKASGVTVPFKIGTMIEVPRAALTADAIAKEAEFFSFGTNDLTQMTCGFSRDDAAAFLIPYISKGIYSADPFQELDQEGVGELVKIAVQKGRATKPALKMGICGEHGGDPSTIAFCNKIGLDYVSCSPFRVPIAILAGAQAAIAEDNAAN